MKEEIEEIYNTLVYYYALGGHKVKYRYIKSSKDGMSHIVDIR